METDYLIVGQGLAGSQLAWHLWARGRRVLFVDAGEEVTSSKVAAGLVTPITGGRIAKSWRLDELGPYAFDFYDRIGQGIGERYFFRKPVVRIFANDEEVDSYGRNVDGFRDYVSEEIAPGRDAARGLEAPLGGFVMTRSGYLDVKGWLQATRKFFGKEEGCGVREEVFNDAELDPGDGEKPAQWQDVTVTGAVVFCRGYKEGLADGSRFFDWVPFKSAKGEILTVTVTGLEDRRVLNRRGNWLLPQRDGKFRTGSTYEWKDLTNEPTKRGRRTIERRLLELLPRSMRYEVKEHEAAVRPIINASKCLAGRHPAHERVAFFNGLGSKGVLNGPFFANMLAEHLVNGAEIEAEVDVRKNF